VQQESAWLSDELYEGEDAREQYKYFMRPEPRDIVSDITVDEETGMRSRLLRVGMVRNAPQDMKKVMRVYLDPIPHIRIDKAKDLQGWYKDKHVEPGIRNRPCFTDAVLTEPYGGFCTVGCAFCYINSGMRGYRGSGLISVPIGYGAQVGRMLDRMKTSAAGYFSSFTDPFTPLEGFYHNTQEGATAFVDRGLPIFFLSRLPYPGWAYDLLKRNPYSYAQKSINTPDPETWRKLSPGALSLEGHLDEIRELKRRGIYVSIQFNPVVPGVVTHDDVVEGFAKLKEAGADHVIVKYVEAGYSWAPAMVERIRKRFGPVKGGQFAELFTENIGGQRTIVEEYRLEGHRRYREAATKLGLTYATCYEYKMERREDGTIINKTGVSIGREFTTAEQCHGQRVPMFSRTDLREPFREVEECPPSGCLYCADESPTGEARCGSELFGDAKALRLVHLKRSVRDAAPDRKPIPADEEW
jgi:DNA repair photolyase